MKKVVDYLKKHIKLVLLIVLMLIFAFKNNKPIDEDITYRLNIKSKRVHSLDCGVGKRAKENNKLLRKDKLKNILDDGYIICGDCNAGFKKSFVEEMIRNILGPDDVDYDDLVLPSREEYLKAIDEVGEWYVNHIPTYQKHLQEELITEYTGNEEYVDTCKLVPKDSISIFGNKYKYITSKTTDTKVEDLNENTKILKAKESAINNYNQNFWNINIKGRLLQYPCELIDDKKSYGKAGDDCVRYWFTVLNSIDSNFVSRIEITSQKKWSGINTELIYKDDKKFAETMIKNGFEIFDCEKELNNEQVNIKKIDGSFELKGGDILCRKGHIQLYIGTDRSDNFGWGKVSRSFPAHYNFSIIENNSINDNYEKITNSNYNEEQNKKYVIKMDKGYGIEYYTRVYRYVGGNANEK